MLLCVNLMIVNGHITKYAYAQESYDSDVEERIIYLEEQIKALTGKVEELSHHVKQLQIPETSSTLESSVQDQPAELLSAKNTDQLTILSSDIEQNQNLTPSSSQFVDDQMQVDYDQAMAFMSQDSLIKAEGAFRKFIKKYGSGPQAQSTSLIINAHYWLGECAMSQNNLSSALQCFAKSYETYQHIVSKNPKIYAPRIAGKAPDALIKLASVFQKIKRCDEACATLQQLTQEFTKLSPGLIKIADRLKNECKCRVSGK